MADSSSLSPARRTLLERYLRGDLPHRTGTQPLISPRKTGNIAPLSFSQQQVWLHSQIAPKGVPLYNETLTVQRRGPLDISVLERTLGEIVRRHEMWRTTFAVVDGEPVQMIHPPNTGFDLPFVDLQALPQAERRSHALRLARNEACKPFDLKSGPLLRAMLVRFAHHDHRLFLTFHQLIFDGVTAYQVFLPELSAIYQALAEGRTSPLADPPIQYADYALWQRYSLQNRIAEQMEYWKRTLQGEIPVLQWPIDHPRPPVQNYRGDIQQFFLAAESLAGLRILSQESNVSLFMILVAGLSALLHRYTGQTDIILGAPTAGRNLPELQGLLGYFLNVLPLRIDLSCNPTFRELLRRVKDAVIGALSNQDVPFTQLVETVHPAPDPSRNPFFQVAISLEPPVKGLDVGWTATQSDIPTGASKLDLYIDVDETPDGIRGPVTYNPDIFDASTISSMLCHWGTLLAGAATDPDCRISDLPLLSTQERQQLPDNCRGPRLEYARDRCIHNLFALQANRISDAQAASFGNQTLTYAQLNQRANRLAHYLQKRGAHSGTLVGIYLERSLDMLVAGLAVMKSGAAYVPLDPAYPSDRISFMVEDAGIQLVLSRESLRSSLPPHIANIVSVDGNRNEIETEEPSEPGWHVNPNDLAYVLYTSGSTGRPKGVAIEHHSLLNFLTSMLRQPGFQCDDTLLAVTTLSFDIAGLELYLPLLAGGRVVIASREEAADGVALQRLISDFDITVMQATPATWRMLLQADWPGNQQLKILCGGEALSRELAEQLLPRCRELWNMYGPTETTIWSSLYRVENLTWSTAPIGKPISNTQMYVLDRNCHPLPVGVAGELYIGGDGLARGYWNRPDLTAVQFLPNPFQDDASARLYKTGDLARYLPDGNLQYLGRSDTQVKLRGFRIELGEIEAVLAQHPAVRQAVAVVHEELGDRRVIAYVVADEDRLPDTSELSTYTKQKLPDYMSPSQFVIVDQLPLTPNGKVDRKALPTVAHECFSPRRQAPRDNVEAQLVAIFESVLGVQSLGTTDDFFRLGGHSLMAAQVVARIRKLFEVELPVRTVFEKPTVAGLAEDVRRVQATGEKMRTPILQARPRAAPADAQQQVFLAQLDNLSAADVQALFQRALDDKHHVP